MSSGYGSCTIAGISILQMSNDSQFVTFSQGICKTTTSSLALFLSELWQKILYPVYNNEIFVSVEFVPILLVL